jgi:AcrR family transcriptional regulator
VHAVTPPELKTPTQATACHIARSAARLFATRGYDATSVRDVTEASGVTQPTLYYHFGNKEGLGRAVVAGPLKFLRGKLGELLAANLDPVERLGQMAETYFTNARNFTDGTRFFYAIYFGPPSNELAVGLEEMMDAPRQLLQQAVVLAAEAGRLPADRAGDFTKALRGMIIVHVVDYLYREGALGPGLGSRLVDDLLRGFGPATKKEAIG